MQPSFQFLLENGLTAVILVIYLHYEIHWGRLHRLAEKIDEVVYAVIALARASDDVDEREVADRLNGHTPDDLLEDQPRNGD
ncbi:MAG: hypothetical protein V5A34_05670 [Halapricum sp.]